MYKLKKIQKNLSYKIFLLNNVDNAGSKIAAVCCVVQCSSAVHSGKHSRFGGNLLLELI